MLFENNMKLEKVCKEILKEIDSSKSRRQVEVIKKRIAKKYNLSKIPLNSEILAYTSDKKIRKLLTTKPTRTISGVSVIAIMAKPAPCPGECIYCPKGVNAPQSYTGLEPAVQRGIRNNYDPFLQTKDRLNQYKITGHPSDKIEIIILGGTFLALDEEYQEWFVKRMLDALNGKECEGLEAAQKLNETVRHRCVGLTIETRADYCFENHINQMLKLGTTRVEIGLQSIYPEVLKKVRRGHTV